MPAHIARGNATRARVRSRVEHVFAAQKCRLGLIVRTIGMARARVKIGLAKSGLQLHPTGLVQWAAVILCAMHIDSVPNRKSHPTILLRESYRADGKVKKRTIANLTNWPEPLVEGLRTLLRGGVAAWRWPRRARR